MISWAGMRVDLLFLLAFEVDCIGVFCTAKPAFGDNFRMATTGQGTEADRLVNRVIAMEEGLGLGEVVGEADDLKIILANIVGTGGLLSQFGVGDGVVFEMDQGVVGLGEALLAAGELGPGEVAAVAIGEGQAALGDRSLDRLAVDPEVASGDRGLGIAFFEEGDLRLAQRLNFGLLGLGVLGWGLQGFEPIDKIKGELFKFLSLEPLARVRGNSVTIARQKFIAAGDASFVWTDGMGGL
jgi:hypothetical protein